MDNPLDMTKQTLERLEAEASVSECHFMQAEVQMSFAAPAEKEKGEGDGSKQAVQEVVQVPERRLSREYENTSVAVAPSEKEKFEVEQSRALVQVQEETRERRERRPSIEYEMMPPPPSPAMRPKSATPRRDFSQPRSPAVNSPYWASGASPGLAAIGLEGPGAVPEYLFSPARQERFGARGSSPKYQDLGLDFQQPQSVGSIDLDMFSPSTPGQSMYGPSTSSGQPMSYPNTEGQSTLSRQGMGRDEPDEASVMSSKHQQCEEVEVTKISHNDENTIGSGKNGKGELGNKDEQIRNEGSAHPDDSVSEVQQLPTEENLQASAEEQTASVESLQNTTTSSVVDSTTGSAPIMQVFKAQMPRKQRKQAVAAESRGAWRFSATIPEEPFTPKVQIMLAKDSPLHSLILPPPTKKIENAKLKPKEKEKVPVKRKGKSKNAKKKTVIKKVKYKCGACGKKCVTLEMVKSHLCLPRLQCLDCLPSEVILPSRPLLLHHLETDHPNLVLPCKQCDQEFHSETLLKWHTKVHEVERQKKEEVAVTQAVADALEVAIANEKSKSQEIVSQKEVMDTVPQILGKAAESVDFTPQEVVDEFHDSNELDNLPSQSIVELEVPVTTIPESSNPEELETIMDISRRDEELEDAPPTPVATPTSLQKSQPLLEPSARSPTFECYQCKKTFNTRLRFNNHRLRCGIDVKKEPTTQRPSKKQNARLEEMKVNWREALMTRDRCGKCGRNNYTEDSLEKHMRVCKGNLLRVRALLPCPFCVNPARSFNSDVSLQGHLVNEHSHEISRGKSRGKSLASQHLFRD